MQENVKKIKTNYFKEHENNVLKMFSMLPSIFLILAPLFF